MQMTGYRVAYATVDDDAAAARNDTTATRLFGDVLTVVGLVQLAGPSAAYLPLSRELLVTLGIPPVGPDRVILRLDHATAVDPTLEPMLAELTARGYALAVQIRPSDDFDLRLLDRFSTVEVDLPGWQPVEVRDLAKQVCARHALPLAAGLADHDDFDGARALGFERFTGPFISRPRITPVRNVPVGQLTALASLARLRAGPAEIEELEEVINRDLGLSLKLLRYINSAFFGIRNDITSIRQAVMMLGARGVTRWAMLVTLTGGPSAPPELCMLALTRARMAEILGRARGGVEGEELFTIGMLSVADALLGMPLEEIVEQLPLADEVVAALLERTGPAGAVLDIVLTYERGNFDADSVRANHRGVARAYLGALRWAESVLEQTR
jgi:EAL and modified HD-GYP domain-containing signal transduction protein